MRLSESEDAVGISANRSPSYFDGSFSIRAIGEREGWQVAATQDASEFNDESLARYDVVTNRWSALPPLPAPRSSHMAAVVNGVLYVAGGWDLDGDPAEATWATTLDALDLSDVEAGWRSLPAPFRVRGLGVAMAGR